MCTYIVTAQRQVLDNYSIWNDEVSGAGGNVFGFDVLG